MKKHVMAISAVVLGGVLLLTSAVADVLVGSGYASLKNAIKTTSAAMASGLDSYTVLVDTEMHLDYEKLEDYTATSKIDNVNYRSETIMRYSDRREDYAYEDEAYYVFDMDEDGKKYRAVTNYGSAPIVIDPFEDEYADDIEKIFDAAVGNLSSVISAEEKDGKTIYSGTLTDAEIPALVNAITSFVAKTAIDDVSEEEYDALRQSFVGDIYVENVSGKAVENENGILEGVIGTLSVSGSDKKGEKHTFTVTCSVEVTDINTTVVEKFDVHRSDVKLMETDRVDRKPFAAKHIGVYKNDITEDDGERFVKRGERVLEIVSVDENMVQGTYTETVDGAGKTVSFRGEMNDSNVLTAYYDDADGEKHVLYITSTFADPTLFVRCPEAGTWHETGREHTLTRVFD